MSTEHLERLDGVHPRLVAVVTAILPVMAALGRPMFVVEGRRSDARQRELYAQGRTAPGPVVTRCDGVTSRSRHQVGDDGYAHAVDLAFQGDAPWSDAHPWVVYGALVRWHGLKWGGAFASLIDNPHMELPL